MWRRWDGKEPRRSARLQVPSAFTSATALSSSCPGRLAPRAVPSLRPALRAGCGPVSATPGWWGSFRSRCAQPGGEGRQGPAGLHRSQEKLLFSHEHTRAKCQRCVGARLLACSAAGPVRGPDARVGARCACVLSSSDSTVAAPAQPTRRGSHSGKAALPSCREPSGVLRKEPERRLTWGEGTAATPRRPSARRPAAGAAAGRARLAASAAAPPPHLPPRHQP